MVSVIIPTYNSSSFIKLTLESVFSQSYKNIEIIVVDDGSKDNTLELVECFYGNLKLIKQTNKGACNARNKGFEHSSGEYIQYLDADDILSPNKIIDQIKVLQNQPDCIANGRWGRFYTDDPFTESIQWGPHKSLQKDLYPVDWLCQNHMSQTACWLIPRHLIEKAGGWDETLTQNQDGEFFVRVICNAKEVIYTPDARVYYRSNLNNSISKNAKKRINIESRYKACESYENVLLKLEDSNKTRKAIANKYQHFVYGAFPYHPELVQKAEKKVTKYGGSSLPPYKGGTFNNLLMKSFGWKFPAKLKALFN